MSEMVGRSRYERHRSRSQDGPRDQLFEAMRLLSGGAAVIHGSSFPFVRRPLVWSGRLPVPGGGAGYRGYQRRGWAVASLRLCRIAAWNVWGSSAPDRERLARAVSQPRRNGLHQFIDYGHAPPERVAGRLGSSAAGSARARLAGWAAVGGKRAVQQHF